MTHSKHLQDECDALRELLCEALPLIEASYLDHAIPESVGKYTHEENAKLIFAVQEKIREKLSEV